MRRITRVETIRRTRRVKEDKDLGPKGGSREKGETQNWRVMRSLVTLYQKRLNSSER